jgi:hypothetical protein
MAERPKLTKIGEEMSRWCHNVDEEPPHFLLIVRERLRPGSEEAYDKNERQLASVSATLGCPHPYLALASVAGATEVWWVNAFVSSDERDGLTAAYARNEPLLSAMLPLGKRKEDFREALITTVTAYRPDLSGTVVLRIPGARFLVIDTTPGESPTRGSVYEADDGERFVIAAAKNRADADDLARGLGPGATILAVQPQWSFPAKSWVDADPEFWCSNPAVREREASR